MPYKDPDKRAAYMREYKGRGKPENPCKCYLILSKHDEMMLYNQGINFRNGFCFTNSPELQARLESHKGYGKFIFSWLAEPCPG